jgi:hypothetical protein
MHKHNCRLFSITKDEESWATHLRIFKIDRFCNQFFSRIYCIFQYEWVYQLTINLSTIRKFIHYKLFFNNQNLLIQLLQYFICRINKFDGSGGSWVFFSGVPNIWKIYIKHFQNICNIVNWCGGNISWLLHGDAVFETHLDVFFE